MYFSGIVNDSSLGEYSNLMAVYEASRHVNTIPPDTEIHEQM